MSLYISYVLGGVTMEQYLEVGKIANTHGIKGEVKVIPLTDDPNRFLDLKWVYLEQNNGVEKMDIEGVKFLKGMVLLKFKQIDDMSAAEKLKGRLLKVDRKNAVKLPKDAFFICDLLGCEVYEENGNRLGTLREVLKTGSNDVFIVEREEQNDLLIPALKSVVKKVDLEQQRMVVVLPEGLVDDEV
jgi:16S rRNA processing protein RimM